VDVDVDADVDVNACSCLELWLRASEDAVSVWKKLR